MASERRAPIWGMLVATNRFFAEIDFLEKQLTPEKAFRDATIIQDGRGLYILLVN